MIRNRHDEPENIPRSHGRRLQQQSGPRPTTRLRPKWASTTRHQTRPADQIRPQNAPAHRNRLPRSIHRPGQTHSTTNQHTDQQQRRSHPQPQYKTNSRYQLGPAVCRYNRTLQGPRFEPHSELCFFPADAPVRTKISTRHAKSAVFFHFFHLSTAGPRQNSRFPNASGVLNRYHFHAARSHRQHFKLAPQPFTLTPSDRSTAQLYQYRKRLTKILKN